MERALPEDGFRVAHRSPQSCATELATAQYRFLTALEIAETPTILPIQSHRPSGQPKTQIMRITGAASIDSTDGFIEYMVDEVLEVALWP